MWQRSIMVKRVASVLALASVAFAYRPTPLRMALPRADVLRPFQEGRALKVISGLTALDAELVRKVSKAAAIGGATHVDIACDAELVRVAKGAAGASFPVMVSSIEPEAFGAAIEAGADMLELGNFDSFYERGLRFSAMDVLDLTARTKALYPNMPLSVTIPHTLPMDQQVALAGSLAHLGVDVIQTEGSPAVKTTARVGTVAWHMEKAVPALAATYALARAAPHTPVMAASGLSEVTAAMALASGAKAVGIGAAVNKLGSEVEMQAKVSAIAQAMRLRMPTSANVHTNVNTL